MRHRLLAGLTALLLLASAAPAAAFVDVGDDLHQDYDACIAKFTELGLRDFVDQLDRSARKFRFIKYAGTGSEAADDTTAADGTGSGGETKWDSDGGNTFQDRIEDVPCATLYHEMQHLVDYDNGVLDNRLCGVRQPDGTLFNTGIPISEVRGLRAENRFRAAHKPKLPLRLGYGLDGAGRLKELPDDGVVCEPIEPPHRAFNCGCSAVGAGDPHLMTFDGRFYEFQAVGEFVMTRATGGSEPLQVHARPSAVNGLRTVSLFTAVAADVGGDRAGLYRVPGGMEILLEGKAVRPPIGLTPLPKGGSITVSSAEHVTLTWPDKSTLDVHAVGGSSLRIVLSLAESRRGKVEGLFGNFDGRPEEDLVIRGGASIGDKPSFETLYRRFGDSWRITQQESLFDYAPGQNTRTFTDRLFPDREVSINDLPNRVAAEAVCRSAGVSAAQTLNECVIDVALTGDPAFARDAVARQGFAAAAGSTMLEVTRPGAEARLDFPGTAGQKVFVDAIHATVADECFPLRLLDPKGTTIGTSCLAGGRGSIDTTTLVVTGRHSVVFKPESAGRVRVRLSTVTDQEGSVVPDGPIALATIADAGAVTRLRFQGSAGRRVYINVISSTLPASCFPLRLLDAAQVSIGVGCVVNGRGYLDGTVLPRTGEYTVLIDPAGRDVGITQLRLISSADQTGQIMVSGPPVAIAVAKPGGIVRLSFDATKGQRITARISAASMADDCFPLQIRDSSGAATLAGGCVIGGQGETLPWQAPVTGSYTVVLDLREAATGGGEIRLVES